MLRNHFRPTLSKDSIMPTIIGEYIDQLTSTELRPIGNMPRGVAHKLYNAARSRAGDPLSYTMASALIGEVSAGQRVLIVTGAGGPPNMPTGEVDGLLGTVALARALTIGLGAEVHILVEERFLAPIAAVARAGQLNIRTASGPPWADSVVIHETPVDDEAALEFSLRIIDELEPTAVIAIEKLSINRNGVIHGVTGLPWSDVHYNAAPLFEEARRRHILTCGIGDGGNEIGWGSFPEVREIMPEGAVCRCPCKGGIAAAVSTDVFLAAAISDWGAYGLVAMMSFMLKRADLIADADYVEDLLRAAAAAGVVCGWYSRPMLSDDGVPLPAQRALATLLETAVTQAFLAHTHSSSH
jgi:hypothetical protein